MKKKIMALMLAGIMVIQSAGTSWAAEFTDEVNVEYGDSSENDNEEAFSDEQTEAEDFEDDSPEKDLTEEAEVPAIASGDTSDENVEVSFDDGTLTISGSGKITRALIADCGYSLSEIKSVIIKKGITEISDWAFYNCRSLSSIVIPNSVTWIGNDAFNNCRSLSSIVIPNSVTWAIASEMFYNCTSLSSIVIPNSVTRIGSKVFYNCINLSSIVIPNSVTEIGYFAFDNCGGFIGYDVYYAGNKAQWEKIHKYSYIGGTVHYNSTVKDNVSAFDISKAKISSVKESYEYTGKAIKPTPKVTLKSKVLTLNRDYKVSYKNNKKVGTATITIKGTGKYTGTKTIQFKIAVTPKLDNLKTTYTIKAGKKQNADTVKIANNGELIVDGSLTAKEIYVNKGGKLIINAGGVIESGTVIVQGGKVSGGGSLKNSGLLKTYKLTVKDTGIISMDGSAQTIVYNEFNMSTSSTKSSFKAGELFIDGSFTLNGNAKNFVADESGTLKTIFCNAGNNALTAKSNKYNLGTVCVASQKAYDALNLKAQNYNSALIYIGLKKPNQKKWSYTLTGKKISIGASEWGVLIGNLYQQVSMNSVYVVTDSHLTETERKFVESVASVWVNTIQTPLNKGLNEYSSKKCQMEFKVGKHNCTLTCNMDGYGSYGVNGDVRLKVDNGAEEVIGMIAAGSIESFKAQATVYLAEGYIKEYYKFTTGTALKTVTSKTNSAKLAGKFLEKIVDKYCFQSLKTSTTEEVKQLKKVFKVVKYLGKAV